MLKRNIWVISGNLAARMALVGLGVLLILEGLLSREFSIPSDTLKSVICIPYHEQCHCDIAVLTN